MNACSKLQRDILELDHDIALRQTFLANAKNVRTLQNATKVLSSAITGGKAKTIPVTRNEEVLTSEVQGLLRRREVMRKALCLHCPEGVCPVSRCGCGGETCHCHGTKDLDRQHWSYKLDDQAYGIDVQFSDSLEVDEKTMSVVIPFADGRRRDGVGDLLEVEGIRTDRHRHNPIVLFDHGKQVQLPVAKAQDPDTGAYTVQIDPLAKQARCRAFFYRGSTIPGLKKDDQYQHALFCEQLFDMVAKGFLRGGSIGYQSIKSLPIPPDFERGTPAGNHLLEVLLLEVSVVVMPANQDTVLKMLSMPRICGKPPCEYLVKALQGGGKAAPRYVNVTDFREGDTVFARSYLSRIGPGGKTVPFAKTGDRLKVYTVSGARIVVTNRAGEVGEFSSAEIRKGKALEPEMPSEPETDLKSIRSIYRQSRQAKARKERLTSAVNEMKTSVKSLSANIESLST